jgi:hypothetical protein
MVPLSECFVRVIHSEYHLTTLVFLNYNQDIASVAKNPQWPCRLTDFGGARGLYH